MIHTRKFRLLILGGSILAAISPITVSPSGHVVPAQACADGTCCPEDKSLCFINGIQTDDAYYNGTGPCIRQT
jgi:hypothetical protein